MEKISPPRRIHEKGSLPLDLILVNRLRFVEIEETLVTTFNHWGAFPDTQSSYCCTTSSLHKAILTKKGQE